MTKVDPTTPSEPDPAMAEALELNATQRKVLEALLPLTPAQRRRVLAMLAVYYSEASLEAALESFDGLGGGP